MPAWTIVPAAEAASSLPSSSTNAAAASDGATSVSPGLVQNWPQPRVTEAASALAIAGPFAASASGRTNTGLAEPISANTGIGCERPAAASNKALPPRNEPVKPTAWMAGWFTSARPTSGEGPWTIEKTPSGMPVSRAAASTARAASSQVPGCAGWAFTTTGQPAARAETVSPPATEKASGKFEAPNTATGPSGTSMRRRSGRGAGRRSGRARSIRASTHEPSSTTSAKRRAWFAVRARSPSRRDRGRAVSARARSTRALPAASNWSAIARRKAARRAGARAAYGSNADSAARAAASISAGVAAAHAGSRAAPVAGSLAWEETAPRREARGPTKLLPASITRRLLRSPVPAGGGLDLLRNHERGAVRPREQLVGLGVTHELLRLAVKLELAADAVGDVGEVGE